MMEGAAEVTHWRRWGGGGKTPVLKKSERREDLAELRAES